MQACSCHMAVLGRFSPVQALAVQEAVMQRAQMPEAAEKEAVWRLTSSDVVFVVLLAFVVLYLIPKRLYRSAHQPHSD